jgi:hypothetical protein
MTGRLAAVLFAASIFSGNGQAAEGEAIVSRIPRHRIESRVIAKVGYSKRRHLLEIEFANGAVYRYSDVSPSVYRDLIAAESKARYYDANIRGNYRSMRVRPRAKDKSAN